MLVTLFTDASWCPTHKIGAFAAWMKVDGRTERAAGPLRGTITTSGQAEIAAMINGLWLIGKRLKPPPGTIVVAQTDCEEAIRVLDPKRPLPAGDRRIPLRLRGLEVMASLGLMLEFRHVQGHKGTKTKRNAVNTWCDKAARGAMIEAREARLAQLAAPRSETSESPPDARQDASRAGPEKNKGRGRRGRRRRGHAPNLPGEDSDRA